MSEFTFSTCKECPRSNDVPDFCLEYGKMMTPKKARKEIPEWCEMEKFVYVRQKPIV